MKNVSNDIDSSAVDAASTEAEVALCGSHITFSQSSTPEEDNLEAIKFVETLLSIGRLEYPDRRLVLFAEVLPLEDTFDKIVPARFVGRFDKDKII